MKQILRFYWVVAAALSASTAMAFPTTVRLMQRPDFHGEGTEVIVRTDRGTVTASGDDSGAAMYQPMIEQGAVKGACYVLETETETDVRFNAALNESGVRSVRKVPCGPTRR